MGARSSKYNAILVRASGPKDLSALVHAVSSD